MNRHLTDEEIEQYIDSEYLSTQSGHEASEKTDITDSPKLKTELILKFEEHLINCDACLEKVTKALDFSISFHQWFAESPTAEQKLLLKILKAAQKEESDVKKRIMKWIKDWQSFTDNTVDVLLNTTYNGISNITKFLFKNTKNRKAKWSFNYPVESFAMRGNPDINFEKRIENTLHGQIGEKDILEIKAFSEEKSIKINCKSLENYNSSPIFLLIPLHTGEPVIRLSRKIKDTDAYEIILDGLNPGKYLLAIEPDNQE